MTHKQQLQKTRNTKRELEDRNKALEEEIKKLKEKNLKDEIEIKEVPIPKPRTSLITPVPQPRTKKVEVEVKQEETFERGFYLSINRLFDDTVEWKVTPFDPYQNIEHFIQDYEQHEKYIIELELQNNGAYKIERIIKVEFKKTKTGAIWYWYYKSQQMHIQYSYIYSFSQYNSKFEKYFRKWIERREGSDFVFLNIKQVVLNIAKIGIIKDRDPIEMTE
jgi:hypothetical protein